MRAGGARRRRGPRAVRPFPVGRPARLRGSAEEGSVTAMDPSIHGPHPDHPQLPARPSPACSRIRSSHQRLCPRHLLDKRDGKCISRKPVSGSVYDSRREGRRRVPGRGAGRASGDACGRGQATEGPPSRPPLPGWPTRSPARVGGGLIRNCNGPSPPRPAPGPPPAPGQTLPGSQPDPLFSPGTVPEAFGEIKGRKTCFPETSGRAGQRCTQWRAGGGHPGGVRDRFGGCALEGVRDRTIPRRSPLRPAGTGGRPKGGTGLRSACFQTGEIRPPPAGSPHGARRRPRPRGCQRGGWRCC